MSRLSTTPCFAGWWKAIGRTPKGLLKYECVRCGTQLITRSLSIRTNCVCAEVAAKVAESIETADATVKANEEFVVKRSTKNEAKAAATPPAGEDASEDDSDSLGYYDGRADEHRASEEVLREMDQREKERQALWDDALADIHDAWVRSFDDEEEEYAEDLAARENVKAREQDAKEEKRYAAMEAAYAAEKEAAALVRDAADEAWAMSRPGGIIGGPRASC